MKCLKEMDFNKDWVTWRRYLREEIEKAGQSGLSDKEIQDLIVDIEDFLEDKYICPSSRGN